MSYTQTQLDALRTAYAEGVLRVTFNNRTIEYRTLKEMKSIIAEMEDSIAGTSTSDKTYYPTFGRSF